MSLNKGIDAKSSSLSQSLSPFTLVERSLEFHDYIYMLFWNSSVKESRSNGFTLCVAKSHYCRLLKLIDSGWVHQLWNSLIAVRSRARIKCNQIDPDWVKLEMN